MTRRCTCWHDPYVTDLLGRVAVIERRWEVTVSVLKYVGGIAGLMLVVFGIAFVLQEFFGVGL